MMKLRGRDLSEWEDEEYSAEALSWNWYRTALLAAKDRWGVVEKKTNETPQQTLERAMQAKAAAAKRVRWAKK